MEPSLKPQEVNKSEKKKAKKPVTNVQYSEESHKSFLLGIKNKKKRKEKKAKQMAKEAIRKARADLRNEKKEQREEVVNQLITKQVQLGIKPLSIFLEGPSGPDMQFIQVDPKKNSNEKKGERNEQNEEEQQTNEEKQDSKND